MSRRSHGGREVLEKLKETDIKTLLRLLKKFRRAAGSQEVDSKGGPPKPPEPEFNNRESSIIATVEQWVKWYGEDLGIDLDRSQR